jgi:hypothetical protein
MRRSHQLPEAGLGDQEQHHRKADEAQDDGGDRAAREFPKLQEHRAVRMREGAGQ